MGHLRWPALMLLGANVRRSMRSLYSCCVRFPADLVFINGAGGLACAAKTCSALDPIWVLVAFFCVASCLHTSRIMLLHDMLCMQWGGGMVVRILPLRWWSSCLKPCSHGLRFFCNLPVMCWLRLCLAGASARYEKTSACAPACLPGAFSPPLLAVLPVRTACDVFSQFWDVEL